MKRAKQQRRHARWRAEERFGVSFGPEAAARVVGLIRAGKAALVRRQSHRVGVYAVEIDGIPAHAVYDRDRKVIVTLIRAPPG
jgi:hypothetical protein